MIFIVWTINDIHIDFNNIHWERCDVIPKKGKIKFTVQGVTDLGSTVYLNFGDALPQNEARFE